MLESTIQTNLEEYFLGEQLLPLTEFLRISNCGHILYFYETLEQYVANAVAYTTVGLRQDF